MFWIGFLVGLGVGLVPLVLLVWKGLTMVGGNKNITQEEIVGKVFENKESEDK